MAEAGYIQRDLGFKLHVRSSLTNTAGYETDIEGTQATQPPECIVTQSTKRPGDDGTGKLILGVFIGLLVMPLGALVYLRFGHPPVAVADAAFPFEAQIVHVPLNARTARDMPKRAPFVGSEEIYEAE